MARGFSSGGASKQATFGGTAQDAYGQATRAITATGGEIMWQQPPGAAKFLLGYKNIWTTGGIVLKYDGDLQVLPAGPGQVTARFALKLQWGSAVPLMLVQVFAVIIAAMFNFYIAAFALILIIASVAYTAWNAASGVPDKVLEQIIKHLQGGAPAPSYTPPAQHYTPAPAAPQPAPAPAPAPAGGGDASAIMEQIKQLGSLRDAGVLTPEEFETKKAELLKRI
jgi:multidrug transporter EmrE-like cation transporter